ncbi:MAG: hypothetical protein HDR33_00845 [Treponema sp.]|nr:hypothetical protein [Treponema sp.]
MVNNVTKEFELYEPMRAWLQQYLENKYKGVKVITIDSHARALDLFLEQYNIINYYPQAVGLDIQIDVLGIVINKGKPNIAFIEAKKTQLNLHDLGQLWSYCKLCEPIEAFLLSSAGLGSLNKVLNNLNRQDLLDFGSGKIIKKMQVGKWDLSAKSIDYKTLVPKI